MTIDTRSTVAVPEKHATRFAWPVVIVLALVIVSFVVGTRIARLAYLGHGCNPVLCTLSGGHCEGPKCL
jgi:hypothetical protein